MRGLFSEKCECRCAVNFRKVFEEVEALKSKYTDDSLVSQLVLCRVVDVLLQRLTCRRHFIAAP